MKSNQTSQTDQEIIYQDVDEIESQRQSRSCFSLVVFWLILYFLLVGVIWRMAPLVRSIQRRIGQTKTFRLKPVNETKIIGNLKEKLNQSFDQTKEKAAESAGKAVEQKTQNLIEETRNQTEEALDDLKNRE